ncbi:MAG: 50S ribosomal protein L25/general stress protein Ctc, partial [Gemmatimonadota bacterium]|nr:50S ribosomal protein L25/general stress protein Ctc [Gemmatimonadota bacterium]
MADQNATLRARHRSETGKGANRQLRSEGLLPAVVYGRGEETRALTLDAHEFDRLMSRIHAATTVVSLEVEGDDARQVLIREVQRHPYRSDILHVDFFQIRADEKIKVRVPLHVEGLAKGVDEGGILQQVRHELEVECLPGEIPSDFTVDVSALEIGDSVHVGDIDPRGAIILDDADLTVCSIVPPTTVELPEEEEDEELP